MAIPLARVRVEILSLSNIPPSALGPGHIRYARANIGAGSGPVLESGRSRPIPAAGGHFDLSVEPSPWVCQLDVSQGVDISVAIELCEDRGDDSPPSPTSVSALISGSLDQWRAHAGHESDHEGAGDDHSLVVILGCPSNPGDLILG